MPSLTENLHRRAEDTRRRRTGDVRFFRRLPPIFELIVPASVAESGTSYLFPLPMPPQQLSIDYPFSVEITPTQDSGLVVERNGVITQEIHIRGTMGQRPKIYTGSDFGKIKPPRKRMSQHEVVQQTAPGASLSGHRFLLHLKHAVFGLYSDLVQDPILAQDTLLILHIPKDDQHFVVEPRAFQTPRSVDRKVIWDYEITLTGVDMAKGLGPISPDHLILNDLISLQPISMSTSSLFSGIALIRKALRKARAAIRDLSLIRGAIEKQVRQLSGILDDFAGIWEEVGLAIEGGLSTIKASHGRFLSATTRCEDAVVAVGAILSEDTVHLFHEIIDATHDALLHPKAFAPSSREGIVRNPRNGLGLLSDRSRASLLVAEAATPPATEAALRSSGLLPGDLTRDELAREQAREQVTDYSSALPVTLDPDDTLPGLASRYLGAARLWPFIAALNDLAPPYISESGLPGTLRGGDRILIPSVAAPVSRAPNPAVLGAPLESPPEETELGVDWMVTVDLISGLEDWVVDTESGSIDLQVAKGLRCLVQDLTTRIETVRGSDPLYPAMGTERVIGVGATDVEADAIRFRVSQSLEADPRVEEAFDVLLTQQTPDTFGIEASVHVRSLREPVSVQGSTLPPIGP